MDAQAHVNVVDTEVTPVLQLWRIFTYYALHADPARPQCLKVPHFIKLCKDAQLISRRVPATVIELEIVKLVTADRNSLTGTDAGSNPNGMVFADFLAMMDVLSVKVYPHDAPDVAMKRLLLENMFLLAGKRRSFITRADLDMENEALLLLTDSFNKELMRIFTYYTQKAELRRTMAMASHLTRRGKTSSVNTTAAPERMTEAQKKMMKALNNLLGYEEFVTFCHDFNLKSTALLTGIQAGEVYLAVVPLDLESCTTKGMNFTQFCQALVCMALTGYRDCASSVSALSKVKALLLFIWKVLNSSEKSQKAVNSRLATVSSHAGSLNMYGSGLFIEQFLAMWTKDSFVDYTSPPAPPSEEEGVDVLHKVVSRVGGCGTGTGTGLGTLEDRDDEPSPESEDNAADTNADNEDEVEEAVITVTSKQLQQLFKLRPELTEFIYMEMVREGVA